MINRWIIQPALLLWFLHTALFISCKQLAELRQSSNISEYQELLEQLDGPLCLSDRMDFNIPMEVKHPRQIEKNNAAFIIKVMLQNIALIFNNTYSSTGWNEIIVESFLGKLHNQMKFWEKILEQIPKKESLTSRNLMRYYQRVQDYLTNKEYSTCAWIVVKAEILRNFVIIGRWTKIFQN